MEGYYRLLPWGILSSHLGDLPALSKAAGMKRSHANVPRAEKSKKACRGICWLCDAGLESTTPGGESHPFEDTSLDASWTTTVGRTLPWDSEPALLLGLPTDAVRQNFFMTDFWHNWHLGLAKHFIASSLVSAIERLQCFPVASVDGRFEWFTRDFAAFCASNRIQCYLKAISRETMSFPQGKSLPVGCWSKGSVATNLMRYLQDFCERFVERQTDDQVMLAIAFGIKCL